MSILLVGGSSLVPGLSEILEARLLGRLPEDKQVQVLAKTRDIDPRQCVWKGTLRVGSTTVMADPGRCSRPRTVSRSVRATARRRVGAGPPGVEPRHVDLGVRVVRAGRAHAARKVLL